MHVCQLPEQPNEVFVINTSGDGFIGFSHQNGSSAIALETFIEMARQTIQKGGEVELHQAGRAVLLFETADELSAWEKTAQLIHH